MKYTFRFSTPVVITTLIVLIGLGVSSYFMLTEADDIVVTIVGCLLSLALLLPVAAIPLSLEWSASEVRLRRLLWLSRYSIEDYEIDECVSRDLSLGIRLFGTGGYFGFFGWFYSASGAPYRLIQTEYTRHYLKLCNRKTGRYTYIAIRPK